MLKKMLRTQQLVLCKEVRKMDKSNRYQSKIKYMWKGWRTELEIGSLSPLMSVVNSI